MCVPRVRKSLPAGWPVSEGKDGGVALTDGQSI